MSSLTDEEYDKKISRKERKETKRKLNKNIKLKPGFNPSERNWKPLGKIF
jgi:hypothetical protein